MDTESWFAVGSILYSCFATVKGAIRGTLRYLCPHNQLCAFRITYEPQY